MPSISIRISIILLSVFVCLFSTLVLAFVAYQSLREAKLEAIEREYSANLDVITPLIRYKFKNVERDLIALSKLPPIDGLARSIPNGGVDPKDGSTSEQWKNRLTQIFTSILGGRTTYFQLRLIDAQSGMELVRVDKARGEEPVAAKLFQDKSEEAYFKPSISLDLGQLYYSDITLNRELGRVTEERQVTIRIATPVAGEDGAVYGFLIVNVDYPALMASLIEELKRGYTHYLIDQNGNYLEYVPSENTVARFVEAGNANSATLADKLIALNSISPSDQISDANGDEFIMTAKRLALKPDYGELSLLLASAVPLREILQELRAYSQRMVYWALGIFLVCSLVAYVLAEWVVAAIVRTIDKLRQYADSRDALKESDAGFTELRKLTVSINNAVEVGVRAAQSEASALAKYEVIFDTVGDGIITCDRKGKIVRVNPAARAMFGYGKRELTGKNLKVLMPGDIQSQHDQYLQHYNESRESTVLGKNRELTGIRKNGEEFPLEIVVTSRWENGELTLIGLLRDITVRKQREQQLQHTLAELKRSNDELDDFAYVVSHDVREPLRGMQMHAQKLLGNKEGLGGDIQRRLGRINELAEKVQGQVSDLLYFSRLGRAELSLDSVNCENFVKEMVDSLKEFLQENSASVIFQSALPTIVADKQRLSSIFTNLITNAVKYNTNEHKRIEISYVDKMDTACGQVKQVFSIKDNGIGIEKRFYSDIFRIFKRLNAESDFGGGTGAGLTFVKKSIEKHGGTIWLESEPGSGTTFYFTFRSQRFDRSVLMDASSATYEI